MSTFTSLTMTFPLFEAPLEDAETDGPGACSACGEQAGIRFAGACYGCFRDGRTERVVETELGPVGAADAEAGRVGEIDPDHPDRVLRAVRVDPAHLRELLRTPGTRSTQGAGWLFCCGRPMVFTGALALEGRGAAEVASVLDADESIDPDVFLDQIRDGSVRTFAYRCPACGRLRGHWDCL